MNDNNLDHYFYTESAKDLLKKEVGKENFELIIAGKQPGYPFNSLQWRVSKYHQNSYWIYFKDIPTWCKSLHYPITQEGYIYNLAESGNLTKTKQK